MPTPTAQHLTSRQLAEAIGVSESSVKRWVDGGALPAARTSGGHRRISIPAAIRFIRQNHLPLERPEVLSLSASNAKRGDETATEALVDALCADDSAAARDIIIGRYLGGSDIASIGDQLLRPAMSRIGELWARDPDGIIVEHRAVDTCLRILHEIQGWIPRPGEEQPTAIAAAVEGDPYELAPLLTSLTLLESGLRAQHLGPNTPLNVLVLAVRKYRATVCGLSVNLLDSRVGTSEWMKAIEEIAGAGCELLVGGRGVDGIALKARARLRVCSAMSELAGFARGLLSSPERLSRMKGPRR